ncbi:hypothetical protein AB0L00_23250 [Actinoallomurus sp. NPDC052308]|uniref:hypothetical protein n=1 Tax=Actinoallomurus sp. NPDC052308 TaxID=3155530 RepID=UPI003424B652
MTEETRPAADALAYVCGQVDSLRAILADGHGPSPLDDLLAAARDGRDLTGPLETLHTTLLAAGDPLGVWGHVRSWRAVNATGIDQRAPFEPVYLCPLLRCSGRRPDNTTVFPLTCTITGRPLRREEL